MKLVYEVLDQYHKARTKEDRVRILRENETWALKDIIRGTMDSTVQWNLPGGAPPYTPNEPHSTPSNLLKQNKQFRYFVKGGPGDTMTKVKREKLFIQLLESIDPEDAKLVIKMINKEKPVRQLTRPIVNEAFPGLLQD